MSRGGIDASRSSTASEGSGETPVVGLENLVIDGKRDPARAFVIGALDRIHVHPV